MDIKEHIKSIKKIHRFAFTPKYQETFYSGLGNIAFIAAAIKVIEEIGWIIVYYDDYSVEAKQVGKKNLWTEKIWIRFEDGKITVKSKSLDNTWWDRGKNSLCVKLFIRMFQEQEKQYDTEALQTLKEEYYKTIQWDDYEIPETLPPPEKRRKPSLAIVLAGALTLAITMGYIIALIHSAVYFFIFTEIGIAILTSILFTQLAKLSNYTNFRVLSRILNSTIIISLVSSQYFLNKIILPEYSFWEYIQRIAWHINKSFNHPAEIIWLLIISGVLILLLLGIPNVNFTRKFSRFVICKVPEEVIDFVYYLLIKEKNEDEIREELSRLGWDKEQYQNDAFDALGTVLQFNESKRK